MLPPPARQTFFGVDLSRLYADLVSGWRIVRRWPMFEWLTPARPVQVLGLDGVQSLWWAGDGAPVPAANTAKGQSRSVPFKALLLAESLLLRRGLSVPQMPAESLVDALRLQAVSSSPFPATDLVWAYSTGGVKAGQIPVELILASRRQIENYRAQNLISEASHDQFEIWALAGAGRATVLPGFGENLRLASVARGRRLNCALVLGAVTLLVALALTPSLQLRMRAVEAVRAHEALQKQTVQLLRQREALVEAEGRVGALKENLASYVDPLVVMDQLTRALPDDASLFTLQIRGLKVSMTGQTSNAAALMQILDARPAFKEVKAPTAAVRPPGASKENFNIEFVLDPALLLNPPASAASAASAAPPAVAPASAASAASPATPASAASAASRGFSIGRGAP